MNSGLIDRLVEHLDKLETEELQRVALMAVQNKGFLQKVFDALREGIIVTGAMGTIQYINQSACQFFGLEPSQVARQTVERLFPGIDWSEIVESGGVMTRDLVIRYPEVRLLNFYVTPLANQDLPDDSDAELLGYVIILRDNTRSHERELKKIEAERFEAIQGLAAGIAHEIGNPLNSLNIHLQVVERKLKRNGDPAWAGELLESLSIARGEIRRLNDIVEKVLRAVRPTRPQMAPTDLNTLLSEALQFIAPEVADRRIHITLNQTDGLPLLSVDQDQMKQVFYNLIRNGSQAIGSDGTITVTTGFDDENVSVVFSDDGGGIPADQVSRVFEPYYTTKETGSGLGLMIVQRIIHDHGGELALSSREGLGTEVTLYLPRVEKLMRFLPQKSEGCIFDVDVLS